MVKLKRREANEGEIEVKSMRSTLHMTVKPGGKRNRKSSTVSACRSKAMQEIMHLCSAFQIGQTGRIKAKFDAEVSYPFRSKRLELDLGENTRCSSHSAGNNGGK